MYVAVAYNLIQDVNLKFNMKCKPKSKSSKELFFFKPWIMPLVPSVCKTSFYCIDLPIYWYVESTDYNLI